MKRSVTEVLPLSDALRIRSAELWLEVREPFRALNELRNLSSEAWSNAWTLRVFQAANRDACELS